MVAQKYAESEFPLVFKYTTVGLTKGLRSNSSVSTRKKLYQKELEFIYPPLTFLSVVPNTKPYKEGIFTCVDVADASNVVTPQMS